MMMTWKGNIERPHSAWGLVGLLALSAVALTACDFEVSNPGPVEEDFLNDPQSQQGLVGGMGRALSQGLNWIGYTGAAVSREIHPAGSTGSFGIGNRWARGVLEETDRDLNDHWEQGSRALWTAESGVARIEEQGQIEDGLLGQAQLWAGYANRLMGENYCEAVIDGGPIEPRNRYFEKAEEHFTNAAANGEDDVQIAAIAGRASVRVHLGKWDEAVSDAQEVPTDFDYVINYHSIGDDDQRNRIAWAVAGTPYKAHTVWNTVYHGYGRSNESPNGDPRVPYSYEEGAVGDAAIQCCGRVDFKPQQKYPDDAAATRLSSGREMRLIEAENLLLGGDWQGAVDIINDLRDRVDVAHVEAESADEAWTRLKRERGIELWLEGRRLGDLFRWDAAGTPGDLEALETPSGSVEEGSHLAQQDLCFPIPPTERETNHNIPTGS